MRRDQIPPPELLTAMNATLQAREILNLFHRLGIDDEFKLDRYERHLRNREQAECDILETPRKTSGSASRRASHHPTGPAMLDEQPQTANTITAVKPRHLTPRAQTSP